MKGTLQSPEIMFDWSCWRFTYGHSLPHDQLDMNELSQLSADVRTISEI